MKKNLYIGGYSILDLNDTNVYKQALICAEQNKPVLVYDDPERYFADTIKIDTDNDDNVVITKGGKTITITDANSVSSVGDIQVLDKHLYHYVINIENTEDNYVGTVEFSSTNNYISDLSIEELYSELQESQITITPGTTYNNTGYGYIKKVENNFTIYGYFNQGVDVCELASTNTDFNATIESKKQIF